MISKNIKLVCLGVAASSVALLGSVTPAQAVVMSSNSSNFNGTTINPGSYIWYNAHLTTNDPGMEGSLFLLNQTVTHQPSGVVYNLPDSVITWVNDTGTPTTVFNNNRWETTIHQMTGAGDGDPFFGGGGFLQTLVPPNDLSGSNPVTWEIGQILVTPGLLNKSFSWQWAAAVYTNFSTDNTQVFPTAVDGVTCPPETGGGTASQSGTPCAFRDFVTGGARGGGGSNFTGSNSGTESFTATETVPEPLTILGAGTAVGFGAFFKGQVAKKKDEKASVEV